MAEFKKCVAFCGLNMFRNIKDMPGTDRVETLLSVYMVPEEDRTVADRLRAAAKATLSKGLVRFDCRSDLEPEELAGTEDFVEVWEKMDLSDCHGFPLWEKEMFLLFASKYEEIYSIFSYYAKSGGTGTGASSGFQLQQGEIVNLSLDCHLPTADFAMARIQLIMKMSDQTGTGAGTTDDRFAATGKGDGSLEMFEFCELLVRIALQRQNPLLGTVGHEHTVEEPLPGCLDYLLTEHILKFAKRDALKEVLEALKEDQGAEVKGQG